MSVLRLSKVLEIFAWMHCIGRFRIVRHKRSAPGYFLSWRQPSVFPVQSFLLAVRRRASSPYSLCHTFNPCRWPAAALCWWPSVQTSFIVTLARNRVNDQEREHARKRQGYFVAWASWQLQRTCSSYLQRMPVPWQTIHICMRADCWILKLFNRQILEIPTNRPTKVCEKTVRFLEKLTCSK